MIAINTKTDDSIQSKFNTQIGLFIGKHRNTIARWKESAKIMNKKKWVDKDYTLYFENNDLS